MNTPNSVRHLKNLIRSRDDLAARIAARKADAAQAVRALALCDELEKTLPDKIALIEAAPIELLMPDFTDENFVGLGELTKQRRTVAALRRLQADLPAIRKYWQQAQQNCAGAAA